MLQRQDARNQSSVGPPHIRYLYACLSGPRVAATGVSPFQTGRIRPDEARPLSRFCMTAVYHLQNEKLPRVALLR